MKAAVLVFPGINRERDMARTLKLVCGRDAAFKQAAHKLLVNTVIENNRVEVT